MSENNKEEYNWYEILELKYYPVAEENEEKILDKIDEKRKEWIRKSKNVLDKDASKFKKYIEMAEKGSIKEIMLNRERRRKLIKNAQEKLFEPIDKIISNISKDDAITEKMIKKIVDKTGLEEEIVIGRIKEKGRKIEVNEYDEKIYMNFCNYINKKFNSSSEFSQTKSYLETINKKDLYEFLISENLNIRGLTQVKINEKLSEIEINNRRKKLIKADDETSAKKKLYSDCEKILKNEQKRKEYDEYLQQLNYKKVEKKLKEVKDIYEIYEKNISQEQSLKFINEINEILKNGIESKSIFIGFCKQENIPHENIPSESSESNTSNWSKNSTDSDWSSKSNETNTNIAKSKELCIKAINAIENFRLVEAQMYLDEAKKYWSENPEIKLIAEKLRKVSTKNTYNTKESKNYTGESGNKNIVILVVVGAILIFLALLGIQKMSENNISTTPVEVNQNEVSNNHSFVGNNNFQNSENTQSSQESSEENSASGQNVQLESYEQFNATGIEYENQDGNFLDARIYGSSNTGRYDTMVIKNISVERYNNLLNGIYSRAFRFKCGVSAILSGTTLYIDDPEDVTSYRDGRENTDEHLKQNGGCFITREDTM